MWLSVVKRKHGIPHLGLGQVMVAAGGGGGGVGGGEGDVFQGLDNDVVAAVVVLLKYQGRERTWRGKRRREWRSRMLLLLIGRRRRGCCCILKLQAKRYP